MKTDKLQEYVIREEVMKLLSDEEVAKVNRAETAADLREGQEYLDMERTVQGVRWASSTSAPTGRVLPRDAVPASTWGKILAIVNHAPYADADKSREPAQGELFVNCECAPRSWSVPVQTSFQMLVRELTRDECRDALRSASFGRLACAQRDQPYVVPTFFAVDGDSIYSFAIPGQKIDWMRDNPKVCLEIDTLSNGSDWTSVVVFGRFLELTDTDEHRDERLHAHSLLQIRPMWWEPGALTPASRSDRAPYAPIFYRIATEQMTGCRYAPAPIENVA